MRGSAVVLVFALAASASYSAAAASDSGGPSATAAKKKKKKCKKGTKRVGRKCVKRPVPSPPAVAPAPAPSVPAPSSGVLDDNATISEDSGAAPIAVLANDAPGTTIASKTNGTHGTVAITGGGTGLNYTPQANYCNAPPGTSLDSFTYTSTSGDTATVTVTVNCQNDPPVAVDDAAFVGKNSVDNPISFEFLLTNDTDIDGPSALDITDFSNVTNGTAFLVADEIRFTPTPGFCDDVAGFDYTLSDGLATDTGHMTITVGAC